MEPNDTHQQLPQLSSYFHQPTTTTASATSLATTVPSPTNGLLPQHNNNNDDSGSHHQMVYPHSVPSSAVTSTLEPAKRKRGRPRKYGTPEQALAAKKTAASSKEKRELLVSGGSGSSYSGGSKKSQLGGLGNSGQGFTPHVISVAAGEDVAQKIMLFMQQNKREICILSASGSISNASLRQPATSGGNITYEGRFEIISLSGSYVRTELGGRTGGLSVCLSSSDGQIVGGGVGGPLKAAGPVQVIVGSFQIETKKDVNAGLKGDSSGSKLTSPVAGASVSSIGFRSPVESYGRNPVRGNDDLQTIGGHFMLQPCGTHISPTRAPEWRGGLDARTTAGYDLTGRTGGGGNQSPENGDYDHMAD
ncbi:AT-hook motif nuclear-localized protein [Melia azedarach]|uniref:AT-hook motif nuclear-localized protein n=1 Tax=Melia azedarach TaxID=155640 RepID=A0ACC1Y7H4_MELAZ|nr:AT-hook motif nuclear-localized protein [Melia azedarach]